MGKELLINWLNDAHATEKALEEVLERQVKDAEGHPEVKSKIQQHLEETRGHAQKVESCIQNLGGKVSTTKSLLANLMGTAQGMLNKPFQDTLVKDAISDYAAENFEIASYKALIQGARTLGEHQVVTVCEGILREEQEMARWLEQHLSPAVTEALEDAKAGVH